MINCSIVMRINPLKKEEPKKLMLVPKVQKDGHQPVCRTYRHPRLCI